MDIDLAEHKNEAQYLTKDITLLPVCVCVAGEGGCQYFINASPLIVICRHLFGENMLVVIFIIIKYI